MKLRCTACRQRYTLSDSAAPPYVPCVKCGARLEVVSPANGLTPVLTPLPVSQLPSAPAQTAAQLAPLPPGTSDIVSASSVSANALPPAPFSQPQLPPVPFSQPQFIPPVAQSQFPQPQLSESPYPRQQFAQPQFPQPQSAQAVFPPPLPSPPTNASPFGPPPLPAGFSASQPPPLPVEFDASPATFNPSFAPEQKPQKDLRPLAPSLDELRPYGIWKNWNSGEIKLPHYLVRARGRQMDAIVQQFVNALWRENLKGVRLGWASELTNSPGNNRPVRVVSEISRGHLGVTDAIFRAEGTDLYVKFQSTARTRITWLRLSMKMAAFLILVPLLLGAYLFGSGAHDSWIKDYAQKNGGSYFNGGDQALFLQNMVKEGGVQIDNDRFIAALKRNGSEKILTNLLLAADERNDHMFSRTANGDMRSLAGPSFYFTSKLTGIEAFFSKSQTPEEQDAAFIRIHPWDHWAMLTMQNDARAGILLGMWNIREEAFFVCAQEHLGHKSVATDTVLMRSPGGLQFCGTVIDRVSTIYARKSVPIAYILGAEHDSELGRIAQKAYAASVVEIPPWSIQKLYFADPSLGTRHLGGPLAAIGFGIGALLWFVPISWLRFPCKFLGWPSPDEFNGMVQARNAWVERVLSDVLLHEFGVQEGDRFSITAQ